jgi:phosphoglycerate dehydrogenase-like enzyme
MSLIIALLGDFKPEQVAALQQALPTDARVIEQGVAFELEKADVAVTWNVDVDQAVLESAPNLSSVVKLDSGSAAIDESRCSDRGIAIQIVESPGLISVAEHAVMLILAVFKRLGIASGRFRAGQLVDGVTPELTTQESYAYNWVGLERFEALYGKTIGLVGLGKIGLEAAKRLKAFETDVAYTKRTRFDEDEEQRLGFRYLPFDELLAASHCVSLHNRFYPETEKMMGAREFALMREGSFFVNTARGRLVDEEALAAALNSGHLAGAALDVFEYEPLQPDSPLLDAPNVILTPHTAGIPIDVSIAQELELAGKRISAGVAG